MSQSPSQHSSIATDSKAASLQRLRRLSRILDNAVTIPGTSLGIGLDPILGLIPGAGDFIGTGLSAYIVLEAARLGVPQATLGKMVFNIILEGLVGVVPVLGDLFDVAWKANAKNIRLLEGHLNFPHTSKKADRWFVVLLLAGLFIFSIGLVTFTVVVIRLLAQAVTG